jgi:hypothetical protein
LRTGSGRIKHWVMRDVTGREAAAPLTETIIVNDPGAMRDAALPAASILLQ